MEKPRLLKAIRRGLRVMSRLAEKSKARHKLDRDEYLDWSRANRWIDEIEEYYRLPRVLTKRSGRPKWLREFHDALQKEKNKRRAGGAKQ